MLVVLGDADPLSRFAEPERWEAALQRCESVVASSLFPTPTALWAHVILPATSALEKEGTITNLEGRTQRLRPVLPRARRASHPELAVLAAAGRHLGLELAASPSLAFRRVAESAPLFAGLTWETIGLTAPLPSERPRAGSAPAPAPPPAEAAGRRRPARRRAPPALLRRRGRAQRATRVPAQRRDRARARGCAAPRHRRGRGRHGAPRGRRDDRAGAGSRARSRPARCASPGTVRRSTAPARSRWQA